MLKVAYCFYNIVLKVAYCLLEVVLNIAYCLLEVVLKVAYCLLEVVLKVAYCLLEIVLKVAYCLFPSALGRVTPDMVVCYRCALTELQTLAYLYRKAIPNDQLPGRSNRSSQCKHSAGEY